MEVYREPIGRYVVEKLEDYAGLPQHRAELAINGIDPDNNWLLVWSFDRLSLAYRKRKEEAERDSLNRQWRVRDRGADAPGYIERAAWF